MGRSHGDWPWQWEAACPSQRLPHWERERTITHYSSLDRILLVGEGDFSFSSALADAFESADNIVATSLDSRERVIRVYKSARITIANLMARGALVLHEIDATKMEWCLSGRMFDIIIFNFPHSGFWGREQDNNVIERHKNLVRGFFKSASQLLSKRGEIHVAHKLGKPYNRWNLVGEAGNHGLTLKNMVDFRVEDYPGYNNKRGDGLRIDDSFPLGACKTFMFRQLIMGTSGRGFHALQRKPYPMPSTFGYDNEFYNSRQPIMLRIQNCDMTMDIEKGHRFELRVRHGWNKHNDSNSFGNRKKAWHGNYVHATSDSSSARNDDKEDQNAARWLQMNRFHYKNHGLPQRGCNSQAWRSPRPGKRPNSPPQQRQSSTRVRGRTSGPLLSPQVHCWGWDTSTQDSGWRTSCEEQGWASPQVHGRGWDTSSQDSGWGTSCEEQDWCSKDCSSSTGWGSPRVHGWGWDAFTEDSGWGTSCEEQGWCSKDCPSSAGWAPANPTKDTPAQQPSDVHAGWEPIPEDPTTQLGWGCLGEPTTQHGWSNTEDVHAGWGPAPEEPTTQLGWEPAPEEPTTEVGWGWLDPAWVG